MLEVKVQRTRYKCSKCDYTRKSQWKVGQHEKTHNQTTCEHYDLYRTIEVDDDYDCIAGTLTLVISCRDCGATHRELINKTEAFLEKLDELLGASKAMQAKIHADYQRHAERALIEKAAQCQKPNKAS